MYINSAYFNNSRIDFKDKSRPLIVGSCGTYRLYTQPKLPTYRPRGRIDYQLLYVVGGKAHFFFDGKEEIVTAGHMVIYRPKEVQKYVYYGKDQTEVYWVHFTGSDVKNILRRYGITDDTRVFYIGSALEYQNLFRMMIQELQMCREDYQELLSMMLRHLFILIHRQRSSSKKIGNGFIIEEIDLALTYFNEHYNKDISIEEYAASRHMSTSWFIRNFKKYTGSTPMQHILSIRISNAESLLETTEYNMTEISSIVGYDNPLYFSRIFKKQKGLSPSEYRKLIKSKDA
ncbi:MAG: helix-turn-helix transcriptional regulator [Lachnospiraceae bacterium]|nr:helix-turn-helix transcriptional regulator [Lachnospiraceae bacterium]